MSRGSGSTPSTDALEFAAYVAAMTAELARLARSHNLPTLAYLLDIARLEAAGAVRTLEVEGDDPQQNRRRSR